ncbi:MAG: type IV toxin-antitoxin system AbiEi family antitoxin domain-containing protein, partial [Clostridia bacterium]|nr:type IV toxin-antitoxin system AbiEi family antitoxin domain-containing protein [Clostridia bacterium]
MSSIDILREISNENNGLILTKAAVEKGISRSNLSKLCDNGKITRIANGQYVISDDLNDELLSLQIRSKYIIFSHETALFLNGISERTPFEHTVTIPTSKTLSPSMS